MTNITTELAEALRGVLTAHKSRQPATVMQAEAELDAIRQAADKARAALARYDSLPRPEGVPELPEPAFRLRWHAADARYTVSKPNIGDTDVFTAEQVQTAYAAGLAAQPQGEPVATLHDDGCFTWKRDEFRLRFDRQRAGWRMDVYAAAPPSQPPMSDEHIRNLMREQGCPETSETGVFLVNADDIGRVIAARDAQHAAALEAAVAAERERCADKCAALASMMEQGAGEVTTGERLRQAERAIRSGDPVASYFRDDMRRAAAGGAVPGWKLVPMEPTQEMIAQACRVVPDRMSVGDEYRAMLSAAPQAPAVVDAGNETEGHDSDCSVHNAPAYKPGPCDCQPTQEMCRAAVRYLNGADIYERGLPSEALEIEEGIYASVWKAMRAAAPQAPAAAPPALIQSGMCQRCGKWAGAHATLPGQPTDHLCRCSPPTPQAGAGEG